MQTPTTEDKVSRFRGAAAYSKIDSKEGFHQFELIPKSRNITKFYCKGLMRYKRLNCGTKSAQDILQIEMLNILAGIENPSQYLRQRNGRGTTVEHLPLLKYWKG